MYMYIYLYIYLYIYIHTLCPGLLARVAVATANLDGANEMHPELQPVTPYTAILEATPKALHPEP